MAELVVATTLVVIAEHFVGLVHLFEMILGILVVGVLVGVILQRKLSVCLLYFILVG